MPTSRLFDDRGRRLFFNHEERAAFLKAAEKATDTTRTFCGLLHYTGCSLTEGLTLMPSQVDFSARTVILQGTTPRRHDIKRAIPVPDSFIALLDEVHDIHRAQSGPNADQPLWPQDRKAMVERVNRVIRRAGIAGGPHARPKGIRYGFLVEAIRCGIILTRTENWMGYSHTSDIGHYVEQLAVHAPELVGDERGDASLMW
jgi:integrase/recombinase XerD